MQRIGRVHLVLAVDYGLFIFDLGQRLLLAEELAVASHIFAAFRLSDLLQGLLALV
jgi:hypothetical protein